MADIQVKFFHRIKNAVLGSLEHAAFPEYHLGVTRAQSSISHMCHKYQTLGNQMKD